MNMGLIPVSPCTQLMCLVVLPNLPHLPNFAGQPDEKKFRKIPIAMHVNRAYKVIWLLLLFRSTDTTYFQYIVDGD